MKGFTSRLPLLATLLAVIILLPSAAAATVIDGSNTQRLESVAFDVHGAGPYVGVSDGRVLKYDGNGGWTTFAYSPSYTKNNCGEFSELPITRESSCAYMGLMRGGEAEVLATEADGKPMRFTNGVDIDQVTGNVYFTDSSTTYTRAQHEMVTKTRDSTGRVMKYDPRTRYPDNVRPDRKGGYWVALNREKFESPRSFDRHLLAVKIGADGKKLQEIKGPKNVRPSEVVERDDGKIYFGSIELSYVGIINT
ncbi:unnamed protein product [Urochloa decumbens]|uniref:Strictosidine synthase conserved region domain-containing protein n=1 Tax=Urochloa decumbens TaxID=240449 RepID=A0ABC9BHI3_9POAL